MTQFSPEGAPEVLPPVAETTGAMADPFDLSHLRPPGFGASTSATPDLTKHTMVLERDRTTGLMNIVSHNVTPDEHEVVASAIAAAGRHLDAVRDFVPDPSDVQSHEHRAITPGTDSQEVDDTQIRAVPENPMEQADDEVEAPNDDELPPEDAEARQGIFGKMTAGVGNFARRRAQSRMTGGRAGRQNRAEETEGDEENAAAATGPRLDRKGRTKLGKNKPTAIKVGIAGVALVTSNFIYYAATDEVLMNPASPIHRAEDLYHGAKHTYDWVHKLTK